MIVAAVREAILCALTTRPDTSANQIARALRCRQQYVSRIRRQVAQAYHLPDQVIGRDGKRYPARRTVAKCGARPEPRPAGAQ
ncbi:MAG: hypothetical protein KBA95_13240 [Acidobacteria bacterium]|nr:hypothetical protein [Acidobacteriota bacterium]